MATYKIIGKTPLYGEISLQSAKNSILPILAAGILCEDEVKIYDVPKISDIIEMTKILQELGAEIAWNGNTLSVDYRNVVSGHAGDGCKKLRASVFLLGGLIGKFDTVVLPLPGGCQIGARPVDIHMDGFRVLHCETRENPELFLHRDRLIGGEISLRMPSVGATVNLMIAAVKAEGRTIIKNAAKEPEIEDLQRFLREMGGKVYGAGTDLIIIDGVKKLKGIEFTPMKDRIEAGTYLSAIAVSGGEGCVKGVFPQNLTAILQLFAQSACKIHTNNDKINIQSVAYKKNIGEIVTGPFPMFPTDLQSPLLPFFLQCEGKTTVEERMFENRFQCAVELQKMGAKIEIHGQRLSVFQSDLIGGRVEASDLRCGAGLVLAGLMAEGETTVGKAWHIDRGYEKLPEKLQSLGARLRREE